MGNGQNEVAAFNASVINAEVALRQFSGNQVSCDIVQIYGNEVTVTASSYTGRPVEVLVIAIVTS